MEYDLYSVYGVSIRYPSGWRVELNPASRKDEGDVVFHSPQGDKLYVSWGPLEKAKSKFGDIHKHAEFSVGRVRSSRDVSTFELTKTSESKVNGHEAVNTVVRFSVSSQGLFGFGAKRLPKKLNSTHLYCEESSRYFIVYMLCTEEASEQMFRVAEHSVDSLKCHERGVIIDV